MNAPTVQSVSALTELIKERLEHAFDVVYVEGEISNFRPSARGHWYFSLVDAHALIACVVFRGDQRFISPTPRNGDRVRLLGSLSLYAPRGSYQLIARELHPVGIGDILALLEKRKQRLAAEGLYASARSLPPFPRTVAIVTSPTGAAIRDILRVISHRNAPLDVRIVPVTVQGKHAGGEIAAAIRYASHHRLGEVMIVTRGGGALEDLLPFSEEVVVRAIAESEIPVISAVGHEIDWALSDYAADQRAPTPSAAGELVCEAAREITDRVSTAQGAIHATYQQLITTVRSRLNHVHPVELAYRFRNYIQPWYQRIDEACDAIERGFTRRREQLSLRHRLATERIAASSPSQALQRGYVIVRDGVNGEIITRRAETHDLHALTLEFADGTIAVQKER